MSSMDDQKSFFLKTKQKYLQLVYEITERIIAGVDPSEEMLKAARDLGRQVDIPEEELLNLGLINLRGANNH
jgi:hypothetical protein